MNERPEVEFVLRAWFEGGPATMSDRVIDVVADRISRQPQRRTRRVLRRTPMNAMLKIAAAIAAAVAIAAAGFALTYRPSGSSVGGTATESPSPSVAPSDAAAPTPTPPWNRYPHCGDPGCAGPIEAGTYTSRGFVVPVTYTLTAPWVNVSDYPEYFMLYPDTLANRAQASTEAGLYPYILMSPWTAVSPSDACPEPDRAPDATRVDANGFRDFMESRDGLSVTDASTITVSGLGGQQLDVTREAGWTGCAPHRYGERPPAETDHFRYIVLDQPSGESLVITLWDPADLDAFLADAMPIIKSFQFDLGTEPSPS